VSAKDTRRGCSEAIAEGAALTFRHEGRASHRSVLVGLRSIESDRALPRSGSTLIEQILASHSRVEGTMELPNILTIVREFDHSGAERDGYPESVRDASRERLRALGRRYLDETRPIRTGRPGCVLQHI
jgi:hypothetical protein